MPVQKAHTHYSYIPYILFIILGLTAPTSVNAQHSWPELNESRWTNMSTADLLAHLNTGNVHAQDEHGYTALMHAADFTPDASVTGLLIKFGSDINQADNEGYTALMWAAAGNTNPDVFRALIISGADLTYQDPHGRTALDWAISNGAPSEIISILENSQAYAPVPSHNRQNKEKRFRYAMQVTSDGPPPKRAPSATQNEAPTSPVTDRAPAENNAFSGEFAQVEEIIFELVNQYRSEHGLAPLYSNAKLAVLARDHSQDMGERDFFSHENPDGLRAGQRISQALHDTYYPVSGGENILYNFVPSDRQHEHEAIAINIMQNWMDSPGHRANILRESYTHIGIGLRLTNSTLYATQKFLTYMVRLDGQQDGDTLDKNSPYVHFIINPALIESSEFVVKVTLPDATARYPAESGGFYTGVGFLSPTWRGEDSFSVLLPVEEYGTGQYSLSLGTAGGTSTFIRNLDFRVE